MSKRIILAILLLFATVTMAADTDYSWDGDGGGNNWSTPNNWTANDGSYPGEEGTDSARFDATAVDCVLDVSPGTLSGFVFTLGYEGEFDFAGNDIDVDSGDVLVQGTATIVDTGVGSIACEGNFTTRIALPDGLTVILNGTGNLSEIAAAAANRADLVIDTSGNITVGTTTNYWDSLSITGGDIDLGSRALTLAEGFSGTSGSIDVGTATITVGTTFNGANVTIIGETLGGLPATINGGTISNVDISGFAHIDARGITGNQPADGGNNDNVRFARGIIGGGVM